VRCAARLVVGVLVAMLVVASVRAQPVTAGDGPVKFTVTHHVGFDGVVISETHAPVTVRIQGGDAAEEGQIIVSSGYARSTSTRVIHPFVTTPGLASEYEISIAIPPGSQWDWDSDRRWVSVEVRDGSGRVRESVRYSTSTQGTDIQLRMPPVSREQTFVLSAGGSSAETIATASTWQRDDQLDGQDVDDGLDHSLLLVEVDVAHLPYRLASYEGVDILVLAGEAVDGLDERAGEAIHAWVERGGRLILVPGSAARSLTSEIIIRNY